MSQRRIISLRLPADLVDWFDAHAEEQEAWRSHIGRRGGSHGGRDSGRTAVIEWLMTAYREGRLREMPRAASGPFPAEEVEAGASPDFPILIGQPAAPAAKRRE